MHIGSWWESQKRGRPRQRQVDNIKMDLRETEKWLNALKMFSFFLPIHVFEGQFNCGRKCSEMQ
jgi:hypothetical protein